MPLTLPFRLKAIAKMLRLQYIIAFAVPLLLTNPAVAQTFDDVPASYWAAPYIEIVAAVGISTGCGGGFYCPRTSVTRAQMAVFLERSVHGGGYVPPPATGNAFSDVDAGSFAANFIEQLYRDGITNGCGNGRFCPSDVVIREQMAVFLLRAKYGSNYSPPAASGIFDDVDPGHWAAAWIEQLAAEGITSGCGNGKFCPRNPVKRDQMAVFLVRTFNLSLPVVTNDDAYTGPVAADADTLRFQQEFWAKTKTTDRCGSCHNEVVGQVPLFVRHDDVNLAYDAALTVVDTDYPAASRIVDKVALGHNCWLADPGVCGAIMATWVENWLGSAAANGGQIVLAPPISIEPGTSRKFPADATSFRQLIHAPILEPYCSACHSSQSQNPQQPYIADADITTAYDAAKSRIKLDMPEDSRLVVKVSPVQLGESHNCWNNDCSTASTAMLNAITAYANGIVPTTIDPSPVYSKALRLTDGTPDSGANRFGDALIALWEFRSGTGFVAYDTSGVDPAIDLHFSGDVSWDGGWGITIGNDPASGPGKAQGSVTSSKKLSDVLKETGEFSIEAWVAPSNVTQEASRIITYSAGPGTRNFTLQQTLYDYDFLLRTSETNQNGDPAHSTPDADEVLQATLQHVIATYSPVDGRRIYVDGQLVSSVDPVPGGSLINWADTFAVVLGNEASGDGLWEGTLRLAAIHRRALTPAQVQQNFEAGVGEKYYLLFDISERIQAAANSSYILFEVQQYDAYSYLFDKPSFVTLDGSTPEGIPIEGLRIGINGREMRIGQTYANLNDTLSAAEFQDLGQPLSSLGAIVPLERGPENDEFFLTFDNLNGTVFDRLEDPMLVVGGYSPSPDDKKSHIGVRTFDEVNATFASITGVDPNTLAVAMTFQEIRNSLPAIENIESFVSSHRIAVARLAIQYCDAAISSGTIAASIWPDFNFDAAPTQAFSIGNRSAFVDPLIALAVGNAATGPQIATQPSYNVIYEELASFQASGGRPDNLIDRLLAENNDTRALAKGVCAATLGSAVTLIQ